MVTRGTEFAEWRRKNGYSLQTLAIELGVKSRQTVSNWEAKSEIPRFVQLALLALDLAPELRVIAGKRPSAKERQQFRKRCDQNV